MHTVVRPVYIGEGVDGVPERFNSDLLEELEKVYDVSEESVMDGDVCWAICDEDECAIANIEWFEERGVVQIEIVSEKVEFSRTVSQAVEVSVTHIFDKYTVSSPEKDSKFD